MAQKKQKVSAKQARERQRAAEERQRRAEEKKARTQMLKRVGIVVVCVILALALSLPTMGLLFVGSGS